MQPGPTNLAPLYVPRLAAPSELPCQAPKELEQYLSNECEERRIFLLRDRHLEWKKRAREAATIEAKEYAMARERCLRSRLAPRLRRCGGVAYTLKCGAGKLALLARGCRQWWVCSSCRRRRANSMRARMTAGLTRAHARAVEGGRRAGLRLLTLTVRHSGDVDADRRALSTGWRAFYRSLRDWLGASAYVAVWEVTPGRDGLGHVHMHVAVVWPRFVPYGRVRRLWLRACPESERISIVGSYGTGEKAANYLSKYLSKGVELAGYSDELRAQVLASFYNQHLVLTARGFWLPKVCQCCGLPWRRDYGAATVWANALADRRSHGAQAADPFEGRGSGDPQRLLGGIGAAPDPGGCGLVRAWG